MKYSALKFLEENPFFLWSFLAIIVVLALWPYVSKRRRQPEKVPFTPMNQNASQVFARRTDDVSAIESIRAAYLQNRERNPSHYSPLEIENLAASGDLIEIPFGKSHGLLWAAETHGAGFFEDLSVYASTIGRSDMAEVVLKGSLIAQRALNPDAVGDSEHPEYKLLEKDANDVASEFADLGGVVSFRTHLEAYLDRHYPWSS